VLRLWIKECRGNSTVNEDDALSDPHPDCWICSQNIVTHHQQPLIFTDDGEEVSAWPEKWPTAWLQARRHTREFAKNYLNDPLARDGDYWTADDIRVGVVPALTHQLLSIDPAVTTKEKSDFTALAVVGWSASQRKAVVRYARAAKIPPGEQLRTTVLRILEQFPDIAGVLIETNQGGDTWSAILHDLPVKIKTIHQSVPKEVRAADLLAHYQKGNVLHEDVFLDLVGQLVAFPKAPHDDLVDAVGAGVAVFLGKKKKVGAKIGGYV
jgi:phage terminase large subunit-like protein